MKFRGPKALGNRPRKTMVCPTQKVMRKASCKLRAFAAVYCANVPLVCAPAALNVADVFTVVN